MCVLSNQVSIQETLSRRLQCLNKKNLSGWIEYLQCGFLWMYIGYRVVLLLFQKICQIESDFVQDFKS